jgi:hypothetical protein
MKELGKKRSGRSKNHDGYIVLSGHKDHLNSWADGKILEHTLVMSNHLGRPIGKKESVHHRNGIKDDNRIENLELRVKNHGCGQSVEEITIFCVDFLKQYHPELLSKGDKS